MSKNKKNKGDGNGKKNRMAGEVWREYDASSKGGAGFDGKDIKYLSKQGWSHNDIMRAAAASQNVGAGADQKLRKLNTQSYGAKDLPDSVLKQMRRHAGITGMSHLNTAEFNFLGGDRNDASNWRVGKAGAGVQGNGMEATIWNGLGEQRVQEWNRKAQNARDGKGNKPVLTWQGINADGTANAPTGTRLRRNDEGELREKNVTWRLPADFVEQKKQEDFDKRMAAHVAANPPKPAEEEQPKEDPPFSIGDWIKPSTPAGDDEQDNDTLPVAPPADGAGGVGAIGTPQNPVKPSYFTEGFENVVNRVYGRPSDWMGDVWKPASSSSGSSSSSSSSSDDDSRQRMSGSGSFLRALEQWSAMR